MEFIKLFNIVTDVYIQEVLHLIINFIVKPIYTHNKEVKMHIKPTKMSCLTAKNEVTHKYAISDGQRCQTYKYAHKEAKRQVNAIKVPKWTLSYNIK